MKTILFLCVALLSTNAFSAESGNYNPGFGVYDPQRICYQAWCYMGNHDNQVGSVVSASNDQGGVGLGAFIGRSSIEFMEMPFIAGNYSINASVVTHSRGRLTTAQIYNGRAGYRQSIVSMPFSPAMARKLMRGRYLKITIYRNNKLYTSATYPLYGFSRSYSHMH